MKCFNRLVIAGIVSIALSGCGGGSGGGDEGPDNFQPVVNPVVNVQEPTPTPTATGLSRLLGTVTLTYNFSLDDPIIFTDTADFDNNSFSDDGGTLVGFINPSRVIGCTELNSGGFEFLCTILQSDTTDVAALSSIELFIFSLQTAQSGSGDYEFCSAFLNELDTQVCSSEIVNSPDGVVQVSINQGVLSALNASEQIKSSPADVAISEQEVQIMKASLDAEFGGIVRNKLSSLTATAVADQLNRAKTAISVGQQ